MTFSDPVANMLTVIRNANMRGYHTVTFPHSSFKWTICKKLAEIKFLSQCWFDEKNRNIKAEIKHINRIKKVSKPSQHIHLKVEELEKYCQRHGIYLISTSLGLLTNREALEKNVGGKVILFIN